ncbi:hypothetical protein CKO31_11500 [Thiohalocapsa halophila]|uniref:Antitermination protein NusG n=1 Tax=Thiohalocapsa halophila TaxID=69359 RepID=A0ABS1CHI2_9GAMM|nr:hypothetical protein [Thiohalocapsa halophila]MBK1631353.1 hypothetical protein [Thiohalocapsa halophila]
MLGKFLLTAAVIVLAFYVIRQRADSSGERGERGDTADGARAAASGGRAGLFSRRSLIQTAAGVVVVTMIVGSALALLQGWERARDVVTVEVSNPITGAVERFEARRTDVGDQTIRTLDGRRIRVSEVERIIIREGR